jgi:hypothetical protein
MTTREIQRALPKPDQRHPKKINKVHSDYFFLKNDRRNDGIFDSRKNLFFHSAL